MDLDAARALIVPGRPTATAISIQAQHRGQPTIVEATPSVGHRRRQVMRSSTSGPGSTYPADQVDFIIKAGRPFYGRAAVHRDPASVTRESDPDAMMAIKGIYAEYGVRCLNHGIGFPTAAIELLLPPTASAWSQGKVATTGR